MAKPENSMLRFEGVLLENMVFEATPGWETERVAHRPPHGDGTFVAELQDAEGEVLVEAFPLIDFEAGCVMEGDAMRRALVAAYLPLHPDARELVFRRKERVLYRRPVAAKPPTIRVESVEVVGKGGLRFRIQWRASHDTALSFQIVYVTGDERVFSLVRGLCGKTAATVDLGGLPGGHNARFLVLATDGLRSSFAASKRLTIEDRSPSVALLEPAADAELPFGQGVSLCGRAFDPGGAVLPDEHLIWSIDGEVRERGRCQALAELEPGEHRIELAYAPDGKALSKESVRIRVRKASAAQKRFLDFLPGLTEAAAAAEPSPIVHEAGTVNWSGGSGGCGCNKK